MEMYVDKGITGTSVEKRPEFMRMIEDAKKKRFDMIITREVSRFARNTVDTLQYTRDLKEYGVEVFFLSDNIRTFDDDGELRLSIMATLAQDESRKTSVRVKAGQQVSMENGVFYGNGNILGYDRIVTYNTKGQKDVKFIINKEQAETVRMIFEMYLSGLSSTNIQHELERKGRKTAMGKDRWFARVICQVLQNSFYCGIITYRKEYVPDYLTQKKVRNHGEIEKLQVKGRHEPIVTVEEFEMVQKIFESRRTDCINTQTPRKTGKPKSASIWSDLLVCECGRRFNMRTWKYKGNSPKKVGYQCYNQINHGSYNSRFKKGLSVEDICQTPMIPGWQLNIMAYYVFKYCSNELQSTLKNKKEDAKFLENKKIFEEKKVIYENAQKRLDVLIDMRTKGEISGQSFIRKHKELEDIINSLDSELKIYEEKILEEFSAEKINNIIAQIQKFFSDGKEIPDSEIEKNISKVKAFKEKFVWYLNVFPEVREQTLASFTITQEDMVNYFKFSGEELGRKKWSDINIYIAI